MGGARVLAVFNLRPILGRHSVLPYLTLLRHGGASVAE